VCVRVCTYIDTYIFEIVKDMGHYDYNSQIVMVVINVFYDYKCSHIGSYIFHIYHSEDEGE